MIKAAPEAVREAAARLFGEVSGRIAVERGSGGQKGLGRGERARRVRGIHEGPQGEEAKN